MDVIEAIRSRKSIRGFKPTPVPREILTGILDAAIRAPSAMNTQPWEITVLTGEALENMRRGNIERLNAGATPRPDIQRKPFEGQYRQRQVDLAIQIFQLMGITREDKQKRAEWQMRGFRIFDAPTAIIIAIDRSLDSSIMSILDIGALVQNICLAALNYGLGTCIEDQGIMFPEVVRKFTGIPESKRIAVCVAVGYPDWDFPANKLQSRREPLEKTVSWCSGTPPSIQ
jgi:nitroreductase